MPLPLCPSTFSPCPLKFCIQCVEFQLLVFIMSVCQSVNLGMCVCVCVYAHPCVSVPCTLLDQDPTLAQTYLLQPPCLSLR